jgi:hypothetical protein
MFISQFEFTISHLVSKDSRTHIVIMYMCQGHLFISFHYRFNCAICCHVEWTSLVLLKAACYPDVAFHSPTEGRDVSSSCYATALSVTTCELKYDVNFVTSANPVNMKTCVTVSAVMNDWC